MNGMELVINKSFIHMHYTQVLGFIFLINIFKTIIFYFCIVTLFSWQLNSVLPI